MLDILKSFPSCNGNGVAAIVPTAGAISVDAHIAAINALVIALEQLTDETEAEIGQHISAIKVAEPNDWEAIVKAKCGISRSRAYELMAIADGTKTIEQSRSETNARQIRHRQKQAAVRDITDSEITELKAAHRRELAGARAQIAEAEKARERQAVRFEHKLIGLSDARDLCAEAGEGRGREFAGQAGRVTQRRRRRECRRCPFHWAAGYDGPVKRTKIW